VALSSIHFASIDSKHEWHLLASEQIYQQLSEETRIRFKTVCIISMKRDFDRVKFPYLANKYCASINPDLVFTILGPTYWRPKPINIQGFASSLLVYDYSYYFNPRVKSQVGLKKRLLNNFKIRMVKNANYLIVETELMRSLVIEKFSFPKNCIFVVENSFSPIFSKQIKLLQRNKPANNPPVIFVPSSHYPNKNLELIPYISMELKKLNVPVKFRFVLSGNAWENIRSLGDKLDVNGYLETVGRVNHRDMAHHYKSSSLVFLPTLVEASSAVYPESFLAEIPLITSDRDFAHELCGSAATYFDPYSPEDAAHKICNLLRSTKLCKSKIQKGKNILQLKYPSPKIKWKKTLRILDEILNK